MHPVALTRPVLRISLQRSVHSKRKISLSKTIAMASPDNQARRMGDSARDAAEQARRFAWGALTALSAASTRDGPRKEAVAGSSLSSIDRFAAH